MKTRVLAVCAAPALLGTVLVLALVCASRAQDGGAPTFSHPAEITHPYLPLSSFDQQVYEGKEKGKKVRVVLTRKSTTKTFEIQGKQVRPLTIEDRESVDGRVAEVTLDYFAQDDAGTVHYLGEQVDNYKNGKIVGHEGAWEYGKGKAVLGVMLPASLKVGDKFQSENVPGVTTEDDEVVSTSATASTPLGTFSNCVKIKETLSDGGVEYKVYAKGIGVVLDDSLKLVSQKKRK